MARFSLVTCSVLFFFCFASIDTSYCSFEDSISMVRCYAKRFRADLAVDAFIEKETEPSMQLMNERCEEFISCYEQGRISCFYVDGYEAMVKRCNEYTSKGRFLKCSDKLFNGNSTAEEQLKNMFKRCFDFGREHLKKSECYLLKKCTEEMVTHNCHFTVLPEVINKFGGIFYDECRDEPEN